MTSSDCIKQLLILICGWLAWAYTLAVIIAELVIGAKAASLVLSYYDYEIDHISIDAFCRNIYQDVKSVASAYLVVSCLCLIWFVLSLISWIWCTTKRHMFDAQPCIPLHDDPINIFSFGALGASAITTLMALSYGGFLTWKLDSLDSNCRDFWDLQVSAGFLAIYGYCQKLLIATGAVGGLWCILLVVSGCLGAFSQI